MLVLKQFPGKHRNRDRENSSWLVAFVSMVTKTSRRYQAGCIGILRPGMVGSCFLEGSGMIDSCSLEGPGTLSSCWHKGPRMISKSERRVDAAQKEVDQCKEVIKVLREKMELDNKRNNESTRQQSSTYPISPPRLSKKSTTRLAASEPTQQMPESFQESGHAPLEFATIVPT
ncbi:unnamed protein product [Timema podura]|uniref:Uncharacterized protein n=1 Tax=Timema podura TaxID=61482 RepID=A0ABN7NPB1_TIMPD|nr:unnamed protein product [Timema podura]